MTDLPVRWAMVTLGEVATSVRNGVFVSRPGGEPNGVPILRISAVRPGSLGLHDIRYSGLTSEELAKVDALLQPGDLLFTRYNGNIDFVGACALVPQGVGKLTYPDKLIRVQVDEDIIDPTYVHYAFQAPMVRAQVRALARTTAGQAGISGTSLRSVAFPLPPLAEQRRIVAMLEDQLSRLEVGSETLRETERRIGALEATLLSRAEDDLAGQGDVAVADLLREPLRNGHSAPVTTGEGVRAISLTAVTKGKFIEEYTKITNAERDRVKDLWLRASDILIQRSNTPDLVGTVAMYDGPENWAIFPDLLIRLRVSSQALPEYVTLMLQRPAARQYFKRSAKGLSGSMPKIDQATILAASVA